MSLKFRNERENVFGRRQKASLTFILTSQWKSRLRSCREEELINRSVVAEIEGIVVVPVDACVSPVHSVSFVVVGFSLLKQ